jgi:hypothetical protein
MKINPELLVKRWPAHWISCPDALLTEFGVYHFRKTFSINKIPNKFIVHVSADNRYRLFVNGKSVCFGPARGDIDRWKFESVDISGALRKGRNCLAAVVWNFGLLRPAAQFTRMTAFLFQADDQRHSFVNTDTSWRVLKNNAYTPVDKLKRSSIGPGEIVDGAQYPWDWEKASWGDRSWKNSIVVEHAGCKSNNTDGWGWGLSPRNIPLMEETAIRFSSIRRSSGITINNDFIQGAVSLKIPAHAKVSFLLDQGVETTAFIHMNLRAGQGSTIVLTYAEALKDKDKIKHNRNEVAGLHIEGHKDIFISGGGKDQSFQTLWWRAYRYILVEIATKKQELEIKDIHGVYTGYPFKEKGSFKSDQAELQNIWDIGWRTARLCAHENYIDCPYYEQLQYTGDTRIQGLISLYVSGDYRLFRNAIEQIDDSRNSEGLTRSSYPRTRKDQIIPPFSLYWICMVHDYFMHCADHDFVKKYLNGIYNILHWYAEKIDGKTGLLGAVPYWNFVDWTKAWPWDNSISGGGTPPGATSGGSSITTLQLADTLDKAAEIFSFFKDARAEHYASVAAKIKKAVLRTYWDKNRKLLADTPAQKSYSQHANVHAVLAGIFSPAVARDVMRKVCTDKSLIQCSFYFRFYLNQALKKAGLADHYIEMLAPWKEMISRGFSTFAETADLDWTRSDCHAWSASPTYDLLATVAGIEPLCAGFAKIKIEPHLGNLKFVTGIVPHPQGKIKVEFENSNGTIHGKIILPRGVTGRYVASQKTMPLKSGTTIV